MAEAAGGKEYRHLVDVDGLLIGIEDPVTTAEHLLARAGRREERRLVQLIGDQELPIDQHQRFRLIADELLIFRSEPASSFSSRAWRHDISERKRQRL